MTCELSRFADALIAIRGDPTKWVGRGGDRRQRPAQCPRTAQCLPVMSGPAYLEADCGWFAAPTPRHRPPTRQYRQWLRRLNLVLVARPGELTIPKAPRGMAELEAHWRYFPKRVDIVRILAGDLPQPRVVRRSR